MRLSFPRIKRKKKSNELPKASQKFLRLVPLKNISRHPGVVPFQPFQVLNKVGIGKKPDIHQKIGFIRNSKAISEGEEVDRHLSCPRSLLGILEDLLPQLMNIEGRRIDDLMGHLPDPLKPAPLQTNPLPDRPSKGERMLPPSLAEECPQNGL